MNVQKQWLISQLRELYPTKRFTEPQIQRLLALLNNDWSIVDNFSDSDRAITESVRVFSKQELPDEENILNSLRNRL